MSSPARVAANRANAQCSTGPRSLEGKAKSSMNAVKHGLGAVKGVGESAIEELVRERTANGPYADLVDLCCRIDLRKVNRRVFEALIRAGTLDTFGENRATLMAQVPMALKIAEQQNAMAEAGQNDLFAMDAVETRPVTVDTSVLPQRDAWTDDLRLQGELETLGLFLTGHPIDRYESDLNALGVTRLSALQEMKVSKERGKQEKIRVARRVEMVARRETQRLLAAAPVVVTSHPAQQGEQALRPSPLLRDVPSTLPGAGFWPGSTICTRLSTPGCTRKGLLDPLMEVSPGRNA